MTDDERPEFSISLDALERSAHVPVADQVTVSDDPAAPMPEPDVDQVNMLRWSAG